MLLLIAVTSMLAVSLQNVSASRGGLPVGPSYGLNGVRRRSTLKFTGN